jgi:hypothetical protein
MRQFEAGRVWPGIGGQPPSNGDVMAASPFGNNMDPLANQRRTMEQTRKIMDPAAGYRGYLERTKLVDPLGTRRIMDQARRAMDPLAEYQRIVQDFSSLVGMDPPPITPEGLSDTGDQTTPEAVSDWLVQNPALIATLLSIAWCCGWLLTQGADMERVGGLQLAALGLAAYFAEKPRGNQS